MIILNFSHPLTRDHLTQIEGLTQKITDQVIEVRVQFNNEEPFEPQLQKVISDIPLSSEDLQTKPILVNLPSLNTISALLLAVLHGRMGYFPPILRLRPVSGITPPQFEVAEVINLQASRDSARKDR